MKMFAQKIFYKFLGLYYKISPKRAEKLKYFLKKKKKLNYNKPISFTEKLAVINVEDHERRNLKAKCADKYLVRKYVESKNGKEILNELYGKWNAFDEIDFSILPNKYVLKLTYGSGYNVIVNEEFDKKKAKKFLSKGLRKKHLFDMGELHYNHKTNIIIAEKYIESIENDLIDYKVYCFNGVPKVILVMSGRQKGAIQKNFYDFEWNSREEYLNGEPTYFKKPNKLDEMYEYSKKLSQDFLFVRVDFYNTSEKLIFGELTFTPAGNYSGSHNQKAEKTFGKWLNIEELI